VFSERISLAERDRPTAWYNLAADLPGQVPPALNPVSRQPVGPRDLEPLLPRALVEQELSAERWIEIPAAVQAAYARWRPTPLVRARALERALKTPARIYFKDESESPSGSHKLNTAIPQAYYNRREGTRRLTTETGAGQWGRSLAMTCALFGLDCTVFMVRLSYQERPTARAMIERWGGRVIPSPSSETSAGCRALADNPDSPGSIGMAISDAIETAASEEETKYAFGSVLNYVMLHQSVIGLETEKQLELAGEEADVLIGCAGGGSNFAGLVLPMVRRKLEGRPIRFLAAEPRDCPTLTRGEYRYDFGDAARLTPMFKMYSLGADYVPAAIRACGLRYHGMSPLVSLGAKLGIVEAVACGEPETLAAAELFADEEGIIPAAESAYAIRAAIDEALRCREQRRPECIVFNLSGHGRYENGHEAAEESPAWTGAAFSPEPTTSI
jgi:tryptophan synthase beta chain